MTISYLLEIALSYIHLINKLYVKLLIPQTTLKRALQKGYKKKYFYDAYLYSLEYRFIKI